MASVLPLLRLVPGKAPLRRFAAVPARGRHGHRLPAAVCLLPLQSPVPAVRAGPGVAAAGILRAARSDEDWTGRSVLRRLPADDVPPERACARAVFHDVRPVLLCGGLLLEHHLARCAGPPAADAGGHGQPAARGPLPPVYAGAGTLAAVQLLSFVFLLHLCRAELLCLVHLPLGRLEALFPPLLPHRAVHAARRRHGSRSAAADALRPAEHPLRRKRGAGAAGAEHRRGRLRQGRGGPEHAGPAEGADAARPRLRRAARAGQPAHLDGADKNGRPAERLLRLCRRGAGRILPVLQKGPPAGKAPERRPSRLLPAELPVPHAGLLLARRAFPQYAPLSLQLPVQLCAHRHGLPCVDAAGPLPQAISVRHPSRMSRHYPVRAGAGGQHAPDAPERAGAGHCMPCARAVSPGAQAAAPQHGAAVCRHRGGNGLQHRHGRGKGLAHVALILSARV